MKFIDFNEANRKQKHVIQIFQILKNQILFYEIRKEP